MSKPSEQSPARLRSVAGTDLERRLLDAATREEPSRELSERMARAIGIPFSAPMPGGQAGPSVAAPKLAAGSSSGLLPWISGAVIAIGAAGAIVATRPSEPVPVMHSVSLPLSPKAPPPAAALAPEPEIPAAVPSPVEREPSSNVPPRPRAEGSRANAPGPDLGGQIALLDEARKAVRAGSGDRGLEILRQYQVTYPAGSFRPEAAALRIEALAKMGRSSEARALAERFVADYGPGPLSDRVTRVAGLNKGE